MAESHKNFIIKVTAGPSYDETTHSLVNVNGADPTTFSTPDVDAAVKVRIQNFRGLPAHAPPSSSYFDSPAHTSDRYGIEFRFTLKNESISGNDLVWGNDFDRPIRDRLPPGFNAAFRFVRWWVDPGLEGDATADKPYLFGPLLSSINVLQLGGKKDGGDTAKKEANEEVLEEGAEDEEGWEKRAQNDVPDDAAARKKFFLNETHKKEWEFEKDREYKCDFFNPYIDFNEFSVQLPGFNIPILKYWDGQPVRYVLKDRKTDAVILVIVFKLVPVSELKEPYNTSSEEGQQAHANSLTRTGSENKENAGSTVSQPPGPSTAQTQPPGAGGDTNDDDVD